MLTLPELKWVNKEVFASFYKQEQVDNEEISVHEGMWILEWWRIKIDK